MIYLKDLSQLPKMFLDYFLHNDVQSMADFGCGYGFWYYILRHHNLLPEACLGVDNDLFAIKEMHYQLPEIEGLYANLTKLVLDKKQVELIVCNHVIEHTTDDKQVLDNIYKSLLEGGVLYISSIVRKPKAWWFHTYDNEVRLSSCHIKEYTSLQDFVDTLKASGFRILQAREHQYYLKIWSIPFWKGVFSIPIPKFKQVEALVQKWTYMPTQKEDTANQPSTEETLSQSSESSATSQEKQTETSLMSGAETKPSQTCLETSPPASQE